MVENGLYLLGIKDYNYYCIEASLVLLANGLLPEMPYLKKLWTFIQIWIYYLLYIINFKNIYILFKKQKNYLKNNLSIKHN